MFNFSEWLDAKETHALSGWGPFDNDRDKALVARDAVTDSGKLRDSIIYIERIRQYVKARYTELLKAFDINHAEYQFTRPELGNAHVDADYDRYYVAYIKKLAELNSRIGDLTSTIQRHTDATSAARYLDKIRQSTEDTLRQGAYLTQDTVRPEEQRRLIGDIDSYLRQIDLLGFIDQMTQRLR